MKFNKCVRCGCFFASSDDVCPSCKSKDEIDKLTLKNFLDNTESPLSLDSLAFNSGVETKNINRYMQSKEFSSYKKLLSDDNFENAYTFLLGLMAQVGISIDNNRGEMLLNELLIDIHKKSEKKVNTTYSHSY